MRGVSSGKRPECCPVPATADQARRGPCPAPTGPRSRSGMTAYEACDLFVRSKRDDPTGHSQRIGGSHAANRNHLGGGHRLRAGRCRDSRPSRRIANPAGLHAYLPYQLPQSGPVPCNIATRSFRNSRHRNPGRCGTPGLLPRADARGPADDLLRHQCRDWPDRGGAHLACPPTPLTRPAGDAGNSTNAGAAKPPSVCQTR
jgi:hypothetical protein